MIDVFKTGNASQDENVSLTFAWQSEYLTSSLKPSHFYNLTAVKESVNNFVIISSGGLSKYKLL